MNAAVAVAVQNVSMSFPQTKHASGVKQGIVDIVSGRRFFHAPEFQALKNISFDVEKGEVLGLIGPNGSGKSTLLTVISGIYRPDSGRVQTNGRVSALLELGSGFKDDLTGLENIRLNGAILGLSPAEVSSQIDQIVEFSGLGRFVEQPIRTYSSGMRVRLGFAIATTIDPEILLIDEVLAVGDEAFARKSLARIEELARGKTTIVVVSHDLQLMKKLCRRLVLLHGGEVLENGPPESVVTRYLAVVGLSGSAVRGAFRVAALEVHDESGTRSSRLASGRPAIIDLEVELLDSLDDTVVLALAVETTSQTVTQTESSPIDIRGMAAGTVLRAKVRIPSLDLMKGAFHVTAGVRSTERKVSYDHGAPSTFFDVIDGSQLYSPSPGVWASRGEWTVSCGG